MMSLRPDPIGPVPAETARVAQAIFKKKGHRYLRLRDELGAIDTDELFAELFPAQGQPAETPWRLALVTVVQCAEGLSDRQVAEAVRSRIDLKYLLGLELADEGFDFSVLAEFRARLLEGGAAHVLLDALLERCRALGLLKPRGKQRTDATHVLAAVRALNRLECVGETLRHTLNVLALVAPDWLRAQVADDWFDRYARRFESARLPQAATERAALAATIGADGAYLLGALDGAAAPAWLRQVPAVATLRRVWAEYCEAPAPDGTLRLRDPQAMLPMALTIHSPYDTDAREATKRSTTWTGYKVHLTETCDDDRPHLIVQVGTTRATTPAVAALPQIQASLAARDLLPDEQYVDAGYTSAPLLVTSARRHGLTLLGPVALDTSWQTRAGAGCDVRSFRIDWDARTAVCPQGRPSQHWRDLRSASGHPLHQIAFAEEDCRGCPCRAQCTQATAGPRTITVHPRAEQLALEAARARQETPDFKERYRTRAGIEGTLSQGVRAYELRRSRYRGLPKTALQHIATAVGINLQRLDDWWTDTPRARTRLSPFAALAA
jgi:transposase